MCKASVANDAYSGDLFVRDDGLAWILRARRHIQPLESCQNGQYRKVKEGTRTGTGWVWTTLLRIARRSLPQSAMILLGNMRVGQSGSLSRCNAGKRAEWRELFAHIPKDSRTRGTN